MYKILVIDEQKDDLENFQDYVEKSNASEKFELTLIYPAPSLEEMVANIIEVNPDALITDYMLNEIKEYISHNVPYDGVELVERFLAIRNGFPCFVMTYYDDKAVKQSDDVNLVYVKNVLQESGEKAVKATFLERLENQIIHYRGKVAHAEERLLRLIELRKAGKTDIKDEEEMIELDHFLESTVNKEHSMPKEYKELSNTNKLEKILSKVDELLKKVEKK